MIYSLLSAMLLLKVSPILHLFQSLYRPRHDSNFLVNFSDAVHACPPLCICGKRFVVRVTGSFIVLPHRIINRLSWFIKLPSIINQLFAVWKIRLALGLISVAGERKKCWLPLSFLLLNVKNMVLRYRTKTFPWFCVMPDLGQQWRRDTWKSGRRVMTWE